MAINIAMIGWYGTETIGDRAILAGLLSFFSKSFSEFNLFLGSLYPFHTERTLLEDTDFWQKTYPEGKFNISLFNSRKIKEMDYAIKKSDIVVMGGGPLMHIEPLFMVEYAFKKAKRLQKKTALVGCGIGPLFHKKYKKSLLNIIDYSDLVILRDSASQTYLNSIYQEFDRNTLPKNIFVSLDPAVECCLLYKTHFLQPNKQEIITINLRSFPQEYSMKAQFATVHSLLQAIVTQIATDFPKQIIHLTPMHYFSIGNDDRRFLNELSLVLKLKNISVQNEPLSLADTLSLFDSSSLNVGMRFHSIVFQTLVAGNNYILDYTETTIGKISGFISEMNGWPFYQDRYAALQSQDGINNLLKIHSTPEKFKYNVASLKNRLLTYETQLRLL